MLQTIFLAKKIEIFLIEEKNANIIINQVKTANLKKSYCSKLRNLLQIKYSIKEINSQHPSDLLANSKNEILQFSQLWAFQDFYSSAIREMPSQIAHSY